MAKQTATVKAIDSQDLADQLQREAQLLAARRQLLRILFNRRGLDRLRLISDEDWQRAQSRDDANSGS